MALHWVPLAWDSKQGWAVCLLANAQLLAGTCWADHQVRPGATARRYYITKGSTAPTVRQVPLPMSRQTATDLLAAELRVP
jgi:hypothetical protein